MDTNGDGRISAAEYGAWLHTIGLTPTEREMKELMLQNDKNGDGKLDFKEYVAFLETQASKISPEEWNAVVFHLWDGDNDGYLTAEEIQSAMHAYGTAIKMEDLKTVMKKYDVDGMGKLSCKDFIRMRKQLT